MAFRGLGWAVGLSIMELFRFGHCAWWWTLQWVLWREFQDLDIPAVDEKETAVELSYGETPTVTLARIFELADLVEGARFVDLGSGRGASVLAAGLMGYTASGLDIVEDYVARSAKAADRLKLDVEFRCQDILREQWPQADLYLLNSTAFPEDMRTKLSGRLAELNSESQIVTYDWALDPALFVEREALRLPVTRGTVLCRFYSPLCTNEKGTGAKVSAWENT